jgi:hypothetical protein
MRKIITLTAAVAALGTGVAAQPASADPLQAASRFESCLHDDILDLSRPEYCANTYLIPGTVGAVAAYESCVSADILDLSRIETCAQQYLLPQN